jgi:threonylcarbamoyladenosine tRNA methylthiotransferase CDKAL1
MVLLHFFVNLALRLPSCFYLLVILVVGYLVFGLRVCVWSFGCSANVANGEVLAGCLATAGFILVNAVDDADIVIFNTCAVKGPTENRVIDAIKKTPGNKKIVVAGCLPLVSFERLCREVRFDGVVGASVGEAIVDVVYRVAAGQSVCDLTVDGKPGLGLPRIAQNPIVSIVPISYGCLGSCAYCCVILARGKLRSYGIEEIVERFKNDYAVGVREFWVTAQDTASYGRDIGVNLADLLFALNKLEGDFKIRVGMMTPNLVLEIQQHLIEVFTYPKIFKFLHLPIQSGDDQILTEMRRFYSAEQFKSTVTAFRESIPDLTVATDVIVGYPGETPQAFQRTLDVLEEVKFDVVNVSKFFARPKTLAAKIKDGIISKDELKRRSTLAASVARQVSFGKNQRWLGWSGSVIVDEQGKVPGSWVGRNFAYKPIVVKSSDVLLGRTLRVKVVEVKATYLKGEIIEP